MVTCEKSILSESVDSDNFYQKLFAPIRLKKILHDQMKIQKRIIHEFYMQKILNIATFKERLLYFIQGRMPC